LDGAVGEVDEEVADAGGVRGVFRSRKARKALLVQPGLRAQCVGSSKRSTLLDEFNFIGRATVNFVGRGFTYKITLWVFYTKAQNVILVFCNQNNMLPQGEIEEQGSR
jgi:hypothetical protein